jgi:hypothetical protein
VLLVAFLSGPVGLLGAGASTTDPRLDEYASIDLVNASRAEVGLGGLTEAADLVEVARRHSREMAAAGEIYHNGNLAQEVSGWEVVGENVGRGVHVEAVHDALMASQTHRDNVLGPYTEIGVGAVWVDNIVYITQVFREPAPRQTAAATPAPPASASAPAAQPAPPPAPAPTPALAGVAPPPAPEPAPAPSPESPAEVLSRTAAARTASNLVWMRARQPRSRPELDQLVPAAIATPELSVQGVAHATMPVIGRHIDVYRWFPPAVLFAILLLLAVTLAHTAVITRILTGRLHPVGRLRTRTAPAQPRLHEGVEVAVEHGVGVPNLHPGSEILHLLIRG